MGAKLGGKGALSEINLTPLIDIILVVLIIMMVNVPIQIEEMGVKLPGAEIKTSRFDIPPEQLVIAVYADGTLALNRRLVTEEVLSYEVTRRLRPMIKKNVFIDGHGDVSYGQIVDMMDLAREAGASKVGLARMKEEGPKPPTSVAPGSAPRGVTLGNPHPVGWMTGKKADRAFQPLMPSANQCYTAALARNPTLSGRVTLMVDVAPDGSLMDHKLSSTNVEDEELVQCLVDLLPTLRYDPLAPDKTARVLYPLLLSPG